MRRAAPLLLASLMLASCAPPGIDPQAQEQIRQRYMAKLFGDEKPAEEKPDEAEAEPPAPPPPVPTVPPPAEGITVTAVSLTGYWRIYTTRMSFGVGPFHKDQAELGEPADRDICELAQVKKKVRAVCLRKAYASSASGSLDEDTLTLEWSTGPGTLIFEGQVKGTDAIDGGMGIGVLGVRVSSQVAASLHKLSPADTKPGPAASEAALRAVLADLDQGAMTETRYTPAALGYIRRAKQAGLGTPDGVLYLGTIWLHRPEEKNEKSLEVFQIRAGGQKTLCGIGLEGELVGDFLCTASYQLS